jgi:hypothetical protein
MRIRIETNADPQHWKQLIDRRIDRKALPRRVFRLLEPLACCRGPKEQKCGRLEANKFRCTAVFIDNTAEVPYLSINNLALQHLFVRGDTILDSRIVK